MTTNDYLQIGVYLIVTLLLVKPLGAFMALAFSDTPNRVTRFGAPVERLIYRVSGIRPDEDMSWKRYALAMLRVQCARLARRLSLAAHAAMAAAQSAGLRCGQRRFGDEHRHQLRHQHQTGKATAASRR